MKMILKIRFLLPLVMILFLAGCPKGAVDLEKVAGGFKKPLYLTSPPGDDTRLFVVEQKGRIQVIFNGVKQEEPFLDITEKVLSKGLEQGLLGLAFHPDYAENGWFYVNYIATGAGDTMWTVIERYTVSDDPDTADPDSAVTLLSFEQNAANHNGGMMAFAADGYLYISTGDGGPGNDPDNRAQSLDTFLGKILRIDVDSASPYAIPPDNPFIEDESARPEIWAYGLRNPWRFSFDRKTGDLYIGDVGERTREEINFEAADSTGGLNFGWRVREGSLCRPGQEDCSIEGAIDPIYEYGKALTASVTGGYVYRGEAIPALQGYYLFADWSTGMITALRYDGANITDSIDYSGILRPPVLYPLISSFGEDNQGELYLCDWFSGSVYQLVPAES